MFWNGRSHQASESHEITSISFFDTVAQILLQNEEPTNFEALEGLPNTSITKTGRIITKQ